jgi:hypothetical protein
MKSTDTPTASKILEQAKDSVAQKYNFLGLQPYENWEQMEEKLSVSSSGTRNLMARLEQASLLAMERIAEMSWEKCNSFTDADARDKSTYMNNLFEREQPKQASIYCDCEDYTSIDRNGNCRTCGGEVKQ